MLMKLSCHLYPSFEVKLFPYVGEGGLLT